MAQLLSGPLVLPAIPCSMFGARPKAIAALWGGACLPPLSGKLPPDGWAPDSGRFQHFPWGDTFNARFVNSAENGNGDTMAVGSFHPSGSSILGAADMAAMLQNGR